MTALEFGTLLEETATPEFVPGNLVTKFLQPPFTVLNTRSGDWQSRRRAWLSLGIKSELGRGAALVSQGGLATAEGARSVYAKANSTPAITEGGTLAKGWTQRSDGVVANAKAHYAGRMSATNTMAAKLARAERDDGAVANPAFVRARTGALPVSGSAGDWSVENTAAGEGGTSIFDPVLTELCYRWWAPEGGSVLDPFAGGSVRGIVAAKLGHPYTGIDLAHEQLLANREQAAAILAPGEPVPHWINGDSANMDALLPAGEEYDLVFSCPPYHDLEVYSDDPADLSAMDWHGFLEAYEAIIEHASERLRRGRFAVFVVSEIRGPDGAYRGLVPRTIHAFERVGLRFYNEAILVNSAGSLPLRVAKYMEATRKLGRVHQNVLCFVKGEPPRGWSYDRPAPPSPQLALFEEPAAPALPSAPDPEAVELAPGTTLHHGLYLRGEPELTPIEQYGEVWLKRDDTYEVAGVRGGKVRTCWRLAQGAVGLVTAGSRSSPQANIVAHVAAALGIPARLHTPEGELSPELLAAVAAGAEVIQHKAGYNNVIIARARADAAERGWREIPFGMECPEAVEATAEQVVGLPAEVRRLVVPVGSGMSLAGILHGLDAIGAQLPVLGVVVGATPTERLDRWAPADWRERVELVPSGSDYHQPAPIRAYRGVALDAHYEAKAAAHLRPGDLLWCVGIRQTAITKHDSNETPYETPTVAPSADVVLPQAQGPLYAGTPCFTCGAPPVGEFHDGSPRYDHSHHAQTLAMFSDEEDR